MIGPVSLSPDWHAWATCHIYDIAIPLRMFHAREEPLSGYRLDGENTLRLSNAMETLLCRLILMISCRQLAHWYAVRVPDAGDVSWSNDGERISQWRSLHMNIAKMSCSRFVHGVCEEHGVTVI